MDGIRTTSNTLTQVIEDGRQSRKGGEEPLGHVPKTTQVEG